MDDAKLKQGFLGESIVRQLLKDCKQQFGQIDLISFDKKTIDMTTRFTIS
jgi:hypothetical protein